MIRTELNYIQTRAAADSIVSAGMGYYQFIAVMDNRTTPICQSLDGEIFPIIELSQGENAPPMHVRCRSTIAASEDDGRQGRKPVGQRAARDENGKRIKIPADMTYRDWKAVYIDKTRTLEDWRKAKDAEYAAAREKAKRNPDPELVKGRQILDKLGRGEKLTPAPTLAERLVQNPNISASLRQSAERVLASTILKSNTLSYQENYGGVKCKIEYVQETFKNGKLTYNSKVYVIPDGTRFIFPINLDPAKQTMTPSRAIALWLQIPLILRSKAQKKVCFLDIENPDDAHWRKVYKNFAGSYATGGEEIIFYKFPYMHSDDYVKYTYCHEVGHFIDQNVGGTTRFSESQLWLDAMRNDEITSGLESVTDYGKNSSSEDFADSVFLYTKDEEEFKTKFPSRAKLLKQIL